MYFASMIKKLPIILLNFTGISPRSRFNNCTHTHEPGCAVLKAVEEHYISASRYQSYLSMLQDKDENKYREAY